MFDWQNKQWKSSHFSKRNYWRFFLIVSFVLCHIEGSVCLWYIYIYPTVFVVLHHGDITLKACGWYPTHSCYKYCQANKSSIKVANQFGPDLIPLDRAFAVYLPKGVKSVRFIFQFNVYPNFGDCINVNDSKCVKYWLGSYDS